MTSVVCLIRIDGSYKVSFFFRELISKREQRERKYFYNILNDYLLDNPSQDKIKMDLSKV